MEPMMKDIKGFEGRYAVTTDGRVWSYPKARQKTGRWLKPGRTRQGYLYVNLTVRPYRYVSRLVSRLVLETFVGPGDGLEADHRDFDRSNNRLENLSWKTHEDNVKHSWENNQTIDRRGSNNGRNFLGEEDVHNIRQLRSKGFTYKQIANTVGLKKSHVAGICTKRIWSHL